MVCAIPAFEVGVGATSTLTVAVAAGHGLIPVVVNVNTAVPVNPTGGVQLAFNVFALGVKVPPAGVAHVPPVADPPVEPDKVTDPTWHIVGREPVLAVGVCRTVMFTDDVTAGHGLMPVVVNVNNAVPKYPAGGVQVAVNVFASGVNVPPAGVVQVPPVADPPTEPANVTVPPWQMVCTAPALTVGVGLTMMFTDDVTAAHGLMPVVVSVSTAVPE